MSIIFEDSKPYFLSARIRLISAMIIHCCVEIPFFIFPVIILLVGSDIFGNNELTWLGLGFIGTIGSLASGLPSPYFGRLSDKYRRSSLIFISLILTILGTLLIGMVKTTYLSVLLGMLILGISLALYHPAGLSWISSAFEDTTNNGYSSNYVRILSLHGLGGSLGVALGPLSVYFLLGSLNWQEIYLSWSIPILIVAISFWIFIGRFEPKNSFKVNSEIKKRDMLPFIKSKNHFRVYYPLILIYCFIITMSVTRGMINFILYAFLAEVKGIEIATAALLVGFSLLLGVIGQMSGGYLGDRFGEKAVLSILALSQVFVISGIFIVDIPEILLFFYIILGITMASFWPSTNSLVAKNSQRKGVAFGFVMLSANLLGAIGPFIDGLLITLDPNRYLVIFLISSIFSLFGFFSLLLFKNNTRKK